MNWVMNNEERKEVKNSTVSYSGRDSEVMEILSSLNLILGKMVSEYLFGKVLDYDNLIHNMKYEIKIKCDLIGNRFPGGKVIGFHDMEIMMMRAFQAGVKIFGTARVMADQMSAIPVGDTMERIEEVVMLQIAEQLGNVSTTIEEKRR